MTQCGKEEFKNISCPIGSTIFIGREFYGRRQEQQLCDQDDEHKNTSTNTETTSTKIKITSTNIKITSSSTKITTINTGSSSSASTIYEFTKFDAQFGKNSIVELFEPFIFF